MTRALLSSLGADDPGPGRGGRAAPVTRATSILVMTARIA
jgi:hypothetical protein